MIKNFIIEKYSGNENAEKWLEAFEKECQRHRVTKDDKIIQILKHFLEPNVGEWYSGTLSKLTINETWIQWKKSFLEVYSDKSWKTVYYAYTFKYLTGSLLDYAVKKERLFLETESTMSNQLRINHIVIGLPISIQDKLDKQEIDTTEKLMNQLRRYSSQSQPWKTNPKASKNIPNNPVSTSTQGGSTSNKTTDHVKSSFQTERSPCSYCTSVGFPNCYHPLERCRRKVSDAKVAANQVNLITENIPIQQLQD